MNFTVRARLGNMILINAGTNSVDTYKFWCISDFSCKKKKLSETQIINLGSMNLFNDFRWIAFPVGTSVYHYHIMKQRCPGSM